MWFATYSIIISLSWPIANAGKSYGEFSAWRHLHDENLTWRNLRGEPYAALTLEPHLNRLGILEIRGGWS